MARRTRGGSMVRSPPAITGDSGLIPELGRFPGGGHGNPPQCSCLENPMGRGAWQATVLGVTNSQTQLKQLSMHASPGHSKCMMHSFPLDVPRSDASAPLLILWLGFEEICLHSPSETSSLKYYSCGRRSPNFSCSSRLPFCFIHTPFVHVTVTVWVAYWSNYKYLYNNIMTSLRTELCLIRFDIP